MKLHYLKQNVLGLPVTSHGCKSIDHLFEKLLCPRTVARESFILFSRREFFRLHSFTIFRSLNVNPSADQR